MTTRERRSFSSEFKLQKVRLYENGKPKNEIIREYDLTTSTFSNPIKQHQNTGSFNHQDILKSDEKELIKLRKEVQHLKMENDVLKQILLITRRNRNHLTECVSIFNIH
ncbi:TPA: transposase [Staphylococcus aureus]|nr:transposase [Staphylococcus aureus]